MWLCSWDMVERKSYQVKINSLNSNYHLITILTIPYSLLSSILLRCPVLLLIPILTKRTAVLLRFNIRRLCAFHAHLGF